ncbi:MAG: glycosyl hydrolase 53 family protein [Ruminococcus sp.]|nr:glycosyl hydrolase 53 family protein [Ruminococcus sp.]
MMKQTMKQSCTKLLALGLSGALCFTALTGCGADDVSPAADTSAQTDVETGDAAQLDGETENSAAGQTDTAQSEGSEDVVTFSFPEGPEESEIYIEPIADISDDFIRGMDASAVLVEEKSGVTYYNYDGEEQDVFMTLAQSGVNYIRIRVWNDPYDENGNGYGGGNNDVATAIELGKRATQYGMKVCIDFHYSDFWADPKRQLTPKAWEGMSGTEKCDALYDFTKESLTEILDAGVNVGMVQIGNEINNGMSGETLLPTVMSLLISGSKAVREVSQSYGKDIQIVVHYTNIEDADGINTIARNLMNHGVDYDIFGLSYYPFWDGTNENMQAVAKNIIDKYGKKVVIAETSYCYTSEDGDGCENSFIGTDDLVEGYAASVQSQATMIRDICAAANEVGVSGVFYWEGTWVPVGEAIADNSPIWEEFGSGWASSYAADYDLDDAGLYYGGCSWDNQAMFDFDGHPLASLNVFKYLKYGSTAPLAVDYIPDSYVACDVGGQIKLPETADVIYNDRSANTQETVTWDEAQLAAIDTNVGGAYDITGTIEDGSPVVCHVNVVMLNHVQNPGFEEADTSMWNVTYEGENNPTDFQVKADDAYSGETAFHFWSADSDMEFAIEQELTDLEPGTYQLMVFAQGGDVKEGAEMELYAVENGEEMTEPFMVTSWANWQNPVIPEIKVRDGALTIGVRMKCNAGSWGTVDDFTLNRISD